MHYTDYSLNDLPKIAKEILRFDPNLKVITFMGEMGVGKTTLIAELCKVLGVTEKISSPTYSIINHYETTSKQPIYHFDFYRIKDVDEAIDLGCEDYFYSGEYCFIEWPEVILPLLPETFINLVFENKEGKRSFSIKKFTNVRK